MVQAEVQAEPHMVEVEAQAVVPVAIGNVAGNVTLQTRLVWRMNSSCECLLLQSIPTSLTGSTESVPMRMMTLSTECDSKLDTHNVTAIVRSGEE